MSPRTLRLGGTYDTYMGNACMRSEGAEEVVKGTENNKKGLEA